MINLISSCTSGKKYTPSDLLQLSKINDKLLLDNAIDIWIENINTNQSPQYKAEALYKGAAWKTTLDILDILSKRDTVNHYVASAGYGLIDANKQIYSYDCTFSSGDDNSISKFINHLEIPSNVQWWDKINTHTIDSFTSNSYFFIVLPYDYLIATQNLIREIISKYDKKVFIFTANKQTVPNFMQPYVIKFDSRFNTFQTGVMITLLQRAVLWLCTEIVSKDILLKHKNLQSTIDKQLESYSDYTMPAREQLTDTEIHEKIKYMITKENISSATQGLKYYRKLGFACEQKRFGKLFKEVKSELI